MESDQVKESCRPADKLATIDLGHNLGLEVTAEGVENDMVLSRLRALGCDTAQGFHFSRPLAAQGFAEWHETRRNDMSRLQNEPPAGKMENELENSLKVRAA